MGLVPVGAAWWDARRARPGLDLWADDNHPNRAGSYLAACVFYAEFTGRDPRSSGYSAGLDLADARFLQEQAAATVLAFEELAPGLAVRLVERAGV